MDFALLQLFGAGLGIGALLSGVRLGYWLMHGDRIGRK